MMPSSLSRRDFVKTAATAAASLPLTSTMRGATAQPAPSSSNASPVSLRWLENRPPAHTPGSAWGVPWPQGAVPRTTAFALRTAAGAPVPVQSWPLAYWPDGSLKWTGHAASPQTSPAAEYILAPGGSPTSPERPVTVTEDSSGVTVESGVATFRISKRGQHLVETITRDGREIARGGRLVCLTQDHPEMTGAEALRQRVFNSNIESVTVEQRGPVRAVVKVEGRFAEDAPASGTPVQWLPFAVRLYFHGGSEAMRVVHSFIFDGEQETDFIRGLGVRFTVPMRDDLHNRHVRFVGDDAGMWGEAVRNIPGWAGSFPLANRFTEQLDGAPMPASASLDERTRSQLETVPAWDDFKLAQLSSDHFVVTKRTGTHSKWLKASQGRRSGGTGYFGGTSGGLAFGLQNFWQMHPTALAISGATTDAAEVTVWLWSPDASAMDLRHYSDRAHGLPLQYEDVQPGFSTPHGIARTHELTFWAMAATPRRASLIEWAETVRQAPRLVCPPEHYHANRAFGIWSLPDTSHPSKARVERELDRNIAFYQREIDVRGWYGFWDFGDVMHTYDRHRHEWRYDVGGYAWQNTELVPDMWLWYSFLRSGRADIFRMAEAMTRHTQEVDVYHLGRFAGLGSRHNVSHWGCGAKEARISMAGLKRFYHYLAADERTGDLMTEIVDADFKTVEINPLRQVAENPGFPTLTRVGPDWFGFASNWLAEWERTGSTKYRDKIITGLKCVVGNPQGMMASSTYGYDPETGVLHLIPNTSGSVSLSHLVAIFGGAETVFELATLIDLPEWDRVWLQYCETYNASPEERARVAGMPVRGGNFPIWYSRLTAYAAKQKNDPVLARRAWEEFFNGFHRDDEPKYPLQPERVEGPTVLNPTDDVPWMETNHTAQWCLNAIQNLELVGDHIPDMQGRWRQG